MNKRSKTLLVVLGSTLFSFASGCATTQVSNQNQSADLIYIGPNTSSSALKQAVESSGLPVIIIGSRAYLPARECIGDRSLGGDSEDRGLGGDSEDRGLGGDSEDRGLGGDSEDRGLGGDSEDRGLGGASAKIQCAQTAYGFRVIYSSDKVTIFDGSRYIEKSSEYEF
jgi:hypothetical protein